MLAAHLRDQRLDLRRDLMRTTNRAVRTVRQARETVQQIPLHPPVHRRTMHPRLRRDLGHVTAVQDRPDYVQPLLDNRQDNQSQSRPP